MRSAGTHHRPLMLPIVGAQRLALPQPAEWLRSQAGLAQLAARPAGLGKRWTETAGQRLLTSVRASGKLHHRDSVNAQAARCSQAG